MERGKTDERLNEIKGLVKAERISTLLLKSRNTAVRSRSKSNRAPKPPT